MNSGAFHTNAGPNRVDSVIVTDYRHLGPIARFTNDLLDLNQPFVYFRDFQLEKALHEQRICPGNDNARVTIGFARDLLYNGPDHIPFAETIPEDLLFPGHLELGLVVHHENLATTNLVEFSHYDLAHEILIPVYGVILLNVTDTLTECLPGRHDSTAAKIFELDFFGNFIPNFEIFIDLLGIGLFDLRYGVFDRPIFHNLADVQDLHIAVIRIQDDLKGIIRPVPLPDHSPEYVFHDQLQCVAIDVFFASDLCKRGNKIRILHGENALGPLGFTRAILCGLWRCPIGKSLPLHFWFEY